MQVADGEVGGSIYEIRRLEGIARESLVSMESLEKHTLLELIMRSNVSHKTYLLYIVIQLFLYHAYKTGYEPYMLDILMAYLRLKNHLPVGVMLNPTLDTSGFIPQWPLLWLPEKQFTYETE
jgi:hypothetical protein